MDPREIWPQVRSAYTAGDFPRCEALLADLPDNEAVRLWSVRMAARRDQPEAVRERAIAYLAAYPPHLEVVHALARAATRLKDLPLVASAWRSVADLAPDPASPLRQAALAHARLGNDAFALVAAERLAAIVDARPHALAIAAATLLDLDRFDTLASLIARIVIVDAAGVTSLVEGYTAAGELRGLAAALAGLREAVADIPTSIDRDAVIAGLLARGAGRERDGLLVDALNDFRAILVLSPDDATARQDIERLTAVFHHQVRALDRVGEFGEAIDTLRILYRSDPADRDALLAYGRALMDAGEFALAEDLWRAAIAGDPDLAEAQSQLARAIEALDRPVDAIAAWNAVLTRWPDNEEAGIRRQALSKTLATDCRAAVEAEDGVTAATCLLALPADAAERPALEEKSTRIGRLVVKAMRRDLMVRNFARVVAAGALGRQIAPDNSDLADLLAKAVSRLQQIDHDPIALESDTAVGDRAEAVT